MDNTSFEQFLKDMPTEAYSALQSKNNCINLCTLLPGILEKNIIINTISGWKEIQRVSGKDLRVYAWSTNTDVEDRFCQIVSKLEGIHITVLPIELRKVLPYEFKLPS